ncbi:MAG: T9SS type A sorting domain-containing protein [Candidatus Kapabacteria bacterium]|nr:T9SS type A sorting domain-containing protein [Candidatus Kapabacteria bacterium]
MNIIFRVYLLVLICVALLLPTVMHAQTVCNEDKGITTNPDAAENSEKPHKRNSNPVIFDWRDKFFNMKVDNTLTGLVELRSPFYNGDVNEYMRHLAVNKDFRPIDGWELIAQRFGKPYDALNDSFQDVVARPMFILYNRYTGILRVLVAPIKNDLAQFLKVSLKHEKVSEGGFPSTLDMAESSIEKPLRALDDYEGDPEFTSVAPFTSSAVQFSYADFPMVYDPCTCGYPSRIHLKVQLIRKATINLQGTTSGKIVEIDPDAGKKDYDTESSSFSLGLKDVVNAGKKASQTFSDLNKFKEATEKKIDEHFATQGAQHSAKKEAAKSSLNILENAIASSGFLKTAFKAVPYVGAAVDFLSVLIGGGKDPEKPQKVQISPLAIDMTSSFSGTIEEESKLADYYFLTPGSMLPTGIIDENVIENEYPYYNEPLGLFNLVETPKALKIHQPAFATKWDECGKGSIYTTAWGPWTGDVCPGGYKDFDTLLFKLESVPEFAVNFNAGFKRNDIEILGSIVFESDNPIVLGNNLTTIAPSENTIVVSDRIVRTRFLPLGCLPDNPLRFVRRDECMLKGLHPNGTWTTFPSLCESRVYLKLLVRLVRSDGSEHSQNVLYVGTFPLSTTRIYQWAGALWESPYDGFDEDRTISGGVHSTSERVWNRITVGPTALVKSNVPPNPTPELELVAGNEIVVVAGTGSGQDVIIEGESHLYIDLPYACTTPVEPISVPALQSFCDGNTYKYSRSFSKAGAGGDDAVAGHPIDALLTSMPNPAGDHVTVRCSHRSTSEAVFALYDTFGGLVQTRTVPADRTRNPEVRFDTSRLPSGTYIIVMSTGVTTLSSSIVVYR